MPNSFMNLPFPLHCKQFKLIFIVDESNKSCVNINPIFTQKLSIPTIINYYGYARLFDKTN